MRLLLLLCVVVGSSLAGVFPQSPPVQPPVQRQDCLVSYDPFATCSATCGGGTLIRKGKIVKQALGGGKPCPHVSQLDKIERCNERPCPPIDCSVQFEPFGECTATCGGGIKTRLARVLTQAKNGGKVCPPLVDRQNCNNFPCPTTPPPPVDCEVTFSQYSVCSVTCGRGFQTKRGFITRQPRNGGKPCPDRSQMIQTQGCDTNIICPQRTPIDCVIEYEPFSPCSASCGGGTQSRWGQITVKPKDGGQQCPPTVEKRQCNLQPCATPPPPPQDCQIWYAPWSECSATCGSGISKRRQIILQQAKNGGRPCPNQSQLVETRPCQAAEECKQKIPQDCVIQWKAFGACSAECGGGLRTRRAFVLLNAEPGGKQCPSLIQSEQCNFQPCPTTPRPPVDCKILYSPWSTCSRSCEGGYQSRNGVILSQPRFGGRPCPDSSSLTETRVCNREIQCPQLDVIDCRVQFRQFGACSVECGGGTRTREADILQNARNGGAPCPPLTETETCNLQACPTPAPIKIDCQIWYSPFSTCSALCGGGIQERRGLILQQPRNGGQQCPSESELVQTRPCNTQQCPQPIDCEVQYSDSPCSAQCGGGVSTRTGVIVVRPQNGGKQCPLLVETKQCNAQPCPIDCQVWFPDFADVPCSVSCGSGIKTRRGIVEVQPQFGGQQCPPLTETQTCSEQACPEPVDCQVWYDDWTQCSATCGGGFRTRTGIIEHPAENGGKPCPPTTQTERCNQQPCVQQDPPVDCQVWYPEFGQCSATCGSGFMTRTGIVEVQPRNGGAACPQLTQTKACQNLPPCFQADPTFPPVVGPPVDCAVWFPEFGQCSATCGGGFQSRTGLIERQPENGGKPCPSTTQTRPCALQPCASKPY